jgi:hypothetical protein
MIRLSRRTSALAWMTGLACSVFTVGGTDSTVTAVDETLSPGLAVHYYRDPEYWGGNWPDGVSLPEVAPGNWTFSSYAYTRTEPVVNHLFIRHGWFSVRWCGWLDTHPDYAPNGTADGDDEAQEYRFEVWADDGCRLTVNGTRLISSWTACAEDAEGSRRSATLRLKPGRYPICVEYFQGQSLREDDKDPMKLYWACPARSLPLQIVPANHLRHTVTDLLHQPGRLDGN